MIEVSVIAILIILVVAVRIAYWLRRNKQLVAIKEHQERLDRQAREYYQGGK